LFCFQNKKILLDEDDEVEKWEERKLCLLFV
jgi:hypothetical protein